MDTILVLLLVVFVLNGLDGVAWFSAGKVRFTLPLNRCWIPGSGFYVLYKKIRLHNKSLESEK